MTARGRTTPDSFIGIGLEHDPSARPKTLHLMISAGLPRTILRMRQVAREWQVPALRSHLQQVCSELDPDTQLSNSVLVRGSLARPNFGVLVVARIAKTA